VRARIVLDVLVRAIVVGLSSVRASVILANVILTKCYRAHLKLRLSAAKH
jgi:hypothetical protein